MALMDTMTNVVGVLTIVLVMIGISLASAVNKVMSALPPVTEEQVRAVLEAISRMKAAPDPAAPALAAKPVDLTGQLAAVDTELARLESASKDKGIKLLDLEALKAESARKTTDLAKRRQEVDALLAERDRLKALLDSTPAHKPPPAKVVRIPAGRPIPPDAQIERILVTKSGAQWVDVAAAKTMLLNETKSAFGRNTIVDRIKKGNDTVNVHDHQKLQKYIDSRKLRLGPFQAQMFFVDWSSSPLLRLTLPENAPTSSRMALQSTLLRLKNTPKTVVMFHVTADGFENYLSARELCDQFGVPAGWEFAGKAEHSIHVPEIETNRPKKTPPAPATPATPEIKRPAAKLD